MTPVISRRHPVYFYGLLIFIVALLSTMATIIIHNYIEAKRPGVPTAKQEMGAAVGILSFLFTIYVIYAFIRSAPRIVIDRELISFNNQTFPLQDVNRIELTGKHGSSFWIIYKPEGAALYFKDGTVKYINDFPYKNISEIKLALKALVLDKNGIIGGRNIPFEKAEWRNEIFDTYTNSPLVSFRILMLPGIGTIPFFTGKSGHSNLWVPVIICLGFAILSLWTMNYFKVSEKYLVVRNYLLFWRVKAFRLDQIAEIVLESGGRAPNQLTIITSDYRNHKFMAASLWTNTWKRLVKRVSTAGIKVRNEGVI